MVQNLFKLSAFPKEAFGGNPAGVVLNADNLSYDEMISIAKEVNFSETSFVMKSDKADFKVRFFTPCEEVNLCGHATIATFNLLRNEKVIGPGIYTQETLAGVLEVVVKKDIVFMEQNPPIFGEIISFKEIKKCFENEFYINDLLPIIVLSTGMKEVFLPVNSVETLNLLVPNFQEIISMSKKHDVIGIHAFSLTSEIGVDAYGRNFAPIVGINEESATGTSNGALGCYLNKFVYKKQINFCLRQGYSMGKPSEIITNLTVKDGLVKYVYVGGKAVNYIEVKK